LSLAEIQNQQKSGTKVPTVPVPMTVSLTAQGILISWPAGGDFNLESRPQVGAGAWSPVTTPPTLSGGRYSVTLPVSGFSQFYRLRSP